MNKRDALKLETGRRVIYGDSMWTAKIRKAREGEVIFVTRNGGIKVLNQFGDIEWVPYHHVIWVAGFDCWWKEPDVDGVVDENELPDFIKGL